MSDAGEALELCLDDGGARYYLAGEAVHNGDVLEVALEEGGWMEVRLEGMPGEVLGYGLVPVLAGGHTLAVKMPAGASYRWPLAGRERR